MGERSRDKATLREGVQRQGNYKRRGGGPTKELWRRGPGTRELWKRGPETKELWLRGTETR